MSKYSRARFDVLVLGGGPAGIAAAVRAAESGSRVGLVDENLSVGGQIWRGGASDGKHSSDALTWIEQLKRCGVTLLCGKRVFHQPASSILMAESTDYVCELSYRNLILATGARERFLPFPGWTLPNVMGAGGLQAMVKSGLPIRGKRVVVAGSGPLLLAVASYLRKQGAKILLICEQASGRKLARFAISLLRYPEKVAQAFDLRKDITRIPLATSSWPLCAHGEQTFEAVTVSHKGKLQTIQCDYLACGFHLVPNTELPTLLGCRIRHGYVQVDDLLQTTVENIFCAGEPTGIGGVDLALIEGQIAGLSATGNTTAAQKLFPKRQRLRQFARLLDETFCLRSELRSLPSPETLVCRCEDVPYSRVREHTCWRAAKLHTRCGMGPCQGRICGPATQFLFKWSPDSVRPPVFPARVEDLAVPPIAEVTGELQ
ncbi:MAG TPA: FAD/NAD(P)-binding oxidoreductase [Candidatus Binatia bacterium]|nr:FAD/NAD(P)-binding oxidoreductase [Candidatus Binatia bacterium]